MEKVLKIVTILALLTRQNNKQKAREVLDVWIIDSEPELKVIAYNLLDTAWNTIDDWIRDFEEDANTYAELEEGAIRYARRCDKP
jgi:hypothetical protein